ncbi:MAG: dihydroxyacetone kinase subunit DhaK [Jhaorihella sp.]
MAMIKKAINDPADLVREIAEGVALASQGRVRLLDQAPVLVRNGIPDGKVAIVTGGGSGHEPMYQGLIGEGFSDAVACGNMFAAPTPDVILEATQAAHQGKGVLYIQGNYAGDNMNYDIAMEMAQDEGIETRVVRSTDDISLPVDLGRRGIAGAFLILKAAGAATAEGYSLDEAASLAQRVADNTRSLSVAFAPGSLPETGELTFEIADDEIEIGMGAHGEKGVATHKMMKADPLTDELVDRVVADFPLKGGERVAVLINNMGATTQMEQFIVTRRVHQRLAELNIAVADTWVGPYCTTQEMTGFSVTLSRLDDEIEKLLERPASNESYLKP